MEAMYSGVGHLGKDDDTMGTNIFEPRAQHVLHREEHQPVLGEDDHQPVLFQEEPQLVAEEQHEPPFSAKNSLNHFLSRLWCISAKCLISLLNDRLSFAPI